MNGPPIEPPLPRPIVRVLQRCLARSPFERFPDARALADALDAALRVAPVPGTRKDIGAQVKETLDRLAALHEGQMSGMVALHLGTGPIRRLDDDPRPAAGAASPAGPGEPASAPYELAPPDPAGGAARTLADLPRPMTTAPGLAPPPIPVPPGLGPPSIPGPPGAGSSTLVGMGKSAPPLPSSKSRPGSASARCRRRARRPARRPSRRHRPPRHPRPPARRPRAPSTPSIRATCSRLMRWPMTWRAARAATTSAARRWPRRRSRSRRPRSPACPSPGSADDFSEAPTHALAGSAAAAALRPGRRGDAYTTYRLDPELD